MAILKDLIVHGSSRFLNKIYASEIQTPLIEADAGIIKKLKADDVTVVGLLDVKGQLHTNSWSNSNIATIDGSFYITPTIGSASGTVSITSSSLTFSGTNYAVSSLYLGDGSSITWPKYSKVLVTGQVKLNGEWIPLGTLLGQLSSAATATSIAINEIKDNKKQSSNVYTALVNSGISSTNYRNLKVSLYQRAASSTDFRPLGIYMTATGINGRTFLDIYGGVEPLNNNMNQNSNYGGFAEPNVRIGNLQGLPNVGGQTPSGWGIYTDNGYFKGIIAADKGYIGSGSRYWVIANYEDSSNPNNSRSYIYSYNGTDNGTDSVTSTVEGIYLGTDGIRNYKDSTHYVTIKDGVITALGVNLTGQINATAGNIGGAHIEGGVLTVPAARVSGKLTAATIDASKISTGDISSERITTNVLTALQAKLTSLNTNNLSAITANLGTITTGVIKHDTVGGTNGIWLSADTDTSSNVTIGNSTARKDWRLLVNNKFGVTKTGDLYASSANISGTITATDGTIGGINIVNGALDVSSISIGNLSGASNYAQKSYVDDAVNDIEIGGRNLIWNSNFQLPINGNWANWGLASTTREVVTINGENWIHIVTTADAFQGYQQSQTNRNGFGQIQAGDKIIFSYDAYSKIEGQKGCIGIHWRDSNDTNISQSWTSFDLTTTKKRYITPVFTVPTNAVGFNIMIGQNIAAAQEIWITNIKGEKGNKATDWTPAPEDTQESINIVQVNTNAINLSPYFSYSPYTINNYWAGFSNHNGYIFTNMGDGWMRIQYTNTSSSVVRRDFFPKFNQKIKEDTDYTWLIEFRNNYSTCLNTDVASNFYLVQNTNCQFWGGSIKENLEGNNNSTTTNIRDLGTNTSEIYKKRFIKTSEKTGSTHWTNGSAENLKGLASFTARCAANTTIDYEVRISLYEGRYLGDYRPYIYNTNIIDRTQYPLALAANMVIPSGRIAVLGLDKKLQVLSTTSFDITCPPLYVEDAYSQTNVTSAITRTTNYNTLDTAFNLTSTHSIQGATANSNVYIVGNLVEKIFTPTTDVLTCIEPTTENGLYYMLLGKMTTASNAILQAEHSIYIYTNGKFQKYEATTATSYITYIDATDGIKIHNAQDTLNYLQLNSTAISMFRDSGDGIYSDEVLRIDDSGIRVGKNEGPHFSLASDKLMGYGNNNNIYFEVGKGDNVITQLFFGDGSRTSFEIGPLIKQVTQVKKENNILIEGTDYNIEVASIWCDIYFKEKPDLNSTITVTYKNLYKDFIYTVSSSDTEDVIRDTQIKIKTHKEYEAEILEIKRSGNATWTTYNINTNTTLERENLVTISLATVPAAGKKVYFYKYSERTAYLLGTSTGQTGQGGDLFYFSSATKVTETIEPGVLAGPHDHVFIPLSSDEIYPGSDLATYPDWTGTYEGAYIYSISNNLSLDTGDQIKLSYNVEEHLDLTPDMITTNYTWDNTHNHPANSMLSIPSVLQIISVVVNEETLSKNTDYIIENDLKFCYLVFNTAPSANEKIEIEFSTRKYNSYYDSTYFNFSNMNSEDAIKGIGAASFGSDNINKGVFCLAEGVGNIVTGYASHVEGCNNIATGSHTHVGGSNSFASGENTFVHGDNLKATYLNSAAFGFYNSPDDQVFSIGKGGSKNSFSINKDGNIQFGGQLLAGTTYADKKPLFTFDTLVWRDQSIPKNGSWTRTGYQLIGKPGYKAIGISGIGIYDGTGGANAAWCVPMRCYVWTASPYDLLDIYIWNQNTTSATSNTYIYVKILFIADTAI